MKQRVFSLPQLQSKQISFSSKQHQRLIFPSNYNPSFNQHVSSGKRLYQIKNHSIINQYLQSQPSQTIQLLQPKRILKPVKLQKVRVAPIIDIMPTQPRKNIVKNINKHSQNKNSNSKNISNKFNKKRDSKNQLDALDLLLKQKKNTQLTQRPFQKQLTFKKKSQQKIIVKDFRQKNNYNQFNPQRQANRQNIYNIIAQNNNNISNKASIKHNIISIKSQPQTHQSSSYSPAIKSYKSNSYLKIFGSPESLYDQFAKYKHFQQIENNFKYQDNKNLPAKIYYKQQRKMNGANIAKQQELSISSKLRKVNPSNLALINNL